LEKKKGVGPKRSLHIRYDRRKVWPEHRESWRKQWQCTIEDTPKVAPVLEANYKAGTSRFYFSNPGRESSLWFMAFSKAWNFTANCSRLTSWGAICHWCLLSLGGCWRWKRRRRCGRSAPLLANMVAPHTFFYFFQPASLASLLFINFKFVSTS
jgi:hypothetical protein